MKKYLLIFIYVITCSSLFGQSKISVASTNYDCLAAYNNQFIEFNYQFRNDLRDCGYGIILDWLTMDPLSFMNTDCGFEALDRFYTNCDGAATSFAACSGLVITN